MVITFIFKTKNWALLVITLLVFLVISQGDTEALFTLEALSDGLPELFESYSVSLTSVEGGGRVSDPKSSSVATPASDDPSGIIGFGTYDLNTLIAQEGDSITIR